MKKVSIECTISDTMMQSLVKRLVMVYMVSLQNLESYRAELHFKLLVTVYSCIHTHLELLNYKYFVEKLITQKILKWQYVFSLFCF